jgi:ribosomal protein S18 acetylase RimI-like enzyme
LKNDVEIKILIGCTELEKRKIYEFLNDSQFMKAIKIEKDVSIDNIQKEIIEIKEEYNFNDIFEVFEDVVFNPSKENIENILLEYRQNNKKTLYGYFLNKKMIGIIGVKDNTENIEVLHFGIHPEFRGRKFGTELMDYIKIKNKAILLSTDNDAMIFYKNYGFKCEEYMDEKRGKRYNCIYK